MAPSEDGFLIENLTILASIWGRFWEPEASQAEAKMEPETRTSLKGRCLGGRGGLPPPYTELGWLGGSAARAFRKKGIPIRASRRPGSHPEAFG